MKDQRTIGLKKECLFCDIAEGKKEEKIVAQNERYLAFPDANPSAPVHLLIIPRVHIGINGGAEEKKHALDGILSFAREVAKKMGIGSSYKLLVNAGYSATKTPDHVHVHLVGGWKSPTEVRHI